MAQQVRPGCQIPSRSCTTDYRGPYKSVLLIEAHSQAVLAPLISSASDTFQARKTLLVGCTLVSVIGAAIAPGSGNIYRLIVAQILIGVGFACVPLAYCIPSEILPRKWRPSEFAVRNASRS